MVLMISSFTSGLSFKERAALVKECYETLSGIYQKSLNNESDKNIEKEYEQVLSVCENHTDRDFHTAMCLEYWSHLSPNATEGGLTKKPTRYIWFMFVLYWLSQVFFLVLMYSLPILIFAVLEAL